MKAFEAHPFANLFPQMQADEYDAFLADIEAHGVQVPIMLYQGKILDGRHRMQAAEDIEERTGRHIECVCNFFQGNDADALRYVYSVNMARRHLSTTQRACIGVSVKQQLQETLKPGRPIDNCGNISTISEERNLSARDIAGSIVSVSGRTIDKAEKIAEEAPDLFERMQAGEMPISAAETALAIRNGTQTKAQAVKAVASEIVASIGIDNVTEEQLERAAKVLSAEPSTAHVSYNAGNNEWYTPQEYIDAANVVMGGIDCDPASTPHANTVVNAKIFHTSEEDGLKFCWQGRVWMNPPYASELIPKFIEKLVSHYETGDVTQAIVLVNNATETAWFCRLTEVASAVMFPKGRVKFWEPTGRISAPLQGQSVIYLGENCEEFRQAFSSFGWSAVL